MMGFLLFLALSSLQAQTVAVKSEEQEINFVSRKGLSTTIELDKKTVQKAWIAALRNWGRVDSPKKSIYWLKDTEIKPIAEEAITLMSRVEESEKGTTVFCALEIGGEYIEQGTREYFAAHKFLYDFAVTLYRQDLNEQIEEVDDVLEATVREHERTEKNYYDLRDDLDKAQQKRRKLYQELEENKKSIEELEAAMKESEAEQEALLEEIDRLRDITLQKKSLLSQIQ